MLNRIKFLFLIIIVLLGSEIFTYRYISVRESGKNPIWVGRLHVYFSGFEGFCTASQVSSSTIVTARHCLSGATSATYGSYALNVKSINLLRGDTVSTNFYSPHPSQSYGNLELNFLKCKCFVKAYGFKDGRSLNRYSLQVVGESWDAYGEIGMLANSISGPPSPGDSGGPVIHDGHIVGVISGGIYGKTVISY